MLRDLQSGTDGPNESCRLPRKNRIAVEEVRRPTPAAGEAVIKITLTTICGTDVHIVRGEYPVKQGLILGHEPVGIIEELGAGLDRLSASRSARPGGSHA